MQIQRCAAAAAAAAVDGGSSVGATLGGGEW